MNGEFCMSLVRRPLGRKDGRILQEFGEEVLRKEG